MKNEAFVRAYYTLSRLNRAHLAVRNEITKRCNVSVIVFSNWTRGITPVPTQHHTTIATVLGKEVSELFPTPANHE